MSPIAFISTTPATMYRGCAECLWQAGVAKIKFAQADAGRRKDAKRIDLRRQSDLDNYSLSPTRRHCRSFGMNGEGERLEAQISLPSPPRALRPDPHEKNDMSNARNRIMPCRRTLLSSRGRRILERLLGPFGWDNNMPWIQRGDIR